MLAATFLLIACEQKEGVPHERTELPATDVRDHADQRTYLRTEDPLGDDNDNIEDMRDLHPNEEALDATKDMRDEFDEAADRRTYERTEEMAEDISDKIENRLD